MRLIALVSTSEKPASRAARPKTSANPIAEAAIPAESRRSRLRAARRSALMPASAEERLRAGPVADDEHGVLLDRVPGGVEEPGATRRRALPDPPAILVVEGRRLGLERVGQALAGGDEGGDARRALRLRLARVRVVLADVRGHAPLRDGSRAPAADRCERSLPPARRG